MKLLPALLLTILSIPTFAASAVFTCNRASDVFFNYELKTTLSEYEKCKAQNKVCVFKNTFTLQTGHISSLDFNQDKINKFVENCSDLSAEILKSVLIQTSDYIIDNNYSGVQYKNCPSRDYSYTCANSKELNPKKILSLAVQDVFYNLSATNKAFINTEILKCLRGKNLPEDRTFCSDF